jgi:hypothetical protein
MASRARGLQGMMKARDQQVLTSVIALRRDIDGTIHSKTGVIINILYYLALQVILAQKGQELQALQFAHVSICMQNEWLNDV